MVDDDSDDGPSLNDLFEADDTDSLEDLNTSDETTETALNSDSNATSTPSEAPQGQDDWARSLLDGSTESESSQPPATVESTTQGSQNSTGGDTPPRDPPATATGSPPAAQPTSSPVQNGLNLLYPAIRFLKTTLTSIFTTVMKPVIFVVTASISFFGYFVPWIIALGTVVALVRLWFENPFHMSILYQYAGTAVLAVVFILSIFAGFAIDDYYKELLE